MKKYILIINLCVLCFVSCNVDNNPETQFYLEVTPIDSVNMPSEFVHGETYSIDVNYIRPNQCYQFNDFIYEINGNERTIAIVNTVYSDQSANCTGEPLMTTVSFDFYVTSDQTYIFKFYQGEDDNGEDHYYIIEVPVVDGRQVSSPKQ